MEPGTLVAELHRNGEEIDCLDRIAEFLDAAHVGLGEIFIEILILPNL